MAAAPGWYRDPDGTAGRFRYWTGTAWSTETTSDPHQPLPGPARPGQHHPKRRAGPIIAGVVIIIVLAVIITLVINDRRSQAIREDPDSIPTTETSGWDDSSPLPTDQSIPSAQPTDVPTGRLEACDQYASSGAQAPPLDGRVHGGPLSFEQLGGDWSEPGPNTRFPFSKDGYLQRLPLAEDLPWEASAHVGISTFPDYRGGVRATSQLVQCVVTSDFYTSVDVKITDNTTKAITISGTPAVRRDTLLRFEHPELKTTGSWLRIIVVESKPLSFYFHAVPMERDDLIADLDQATGSLQVD